MASGNLIVVDEYFTKLAKTYEHYGRSVESAVDEYLKKLHDARENAVKGGETATALDSYVGYAEQLRGKAEAVTDDLAALARGYVTAINEADEFLF